MFWAHFNNTTIILIILVTITSLVLINTDLLLLCSLSRPVWLTGTAWYGSEIILRRNETGAVIVFNEGPLLSLWRWASSPPPLNGWSSKKPSALFEIPHLSASTPMDRPPAHCRRKTMRADLERGGGGSGGLREYQVSYQRQQYGGNWKPNKPKWDEVPDVKRVSGTEAP